MDVVTLQSWPGPIARLLNRAQLARDPKVQHDLLLSAWEATVRLLVALEPPRDRSALRRPSLGDWIPALPQSQQQAREERLLALAKLLSEEANDAPRTSKGTLKQWLQHLPAYRNRVHGHGAPRAASFYERAWRALCDGLLACQQLGLLWPEGERLVLVEQITLDGNGQRQARLLSVMGLAMTLDQPAVVVGEQVRSGQLYWASQGTLRALSPWLLWDAQQERVLFFNDAHRGLSFLDYESGKTLKGKALQAAAPGAADPTIHDDPPGPAGDEAPGGGEGGGQGGDKAPGVAAAGATAGTAATGTAAPGASAWRARGLWWGAWLLVGVLIGGMVWRASKVSPRDWLFVDRRDGWGWSDRCWGHLHADRLDAAEKACHRGLEVASPESKARRALHYNLGLIEERRGHLPDAALWMAKALVIEQHPEIIAALDRVCVRAGAPERGAGETRVRRVMSWPKSDGGTIREDTSINSTKLGVLSFGTCVWAGEAKKTPLGIWYRIEAPAATGGQVSGWMHSDILVPKK